MKNAEPFAIAKAATAGMFDSTVDQPVCTTAPPRRRVGHGSQP